MENLKSLVLKRFWLPFFVIAGILFFPYSVLACSGITRGPNWTPPAMQDRLNDVQVVLEGIVTNFEGPDYPYTVRVKVQQYFKGSGPQTVRVEGFGSGASCLYEIEIGQSAIFFLNGTPNQLLEIGKTADAKYADGWYLLEPVSSKIVTQIVTATGHEPVLPDGVTLVATITPLIQTTPALTPTLSVEATPRPISPTVEVNTTQSVLIQPNSKPANDGLSGWLVAGLVLLGLAVMTAGIFLWRKQRRS